MYQATRAGFTGGVVVDFPHSSKAKKYYLCLFAGISGTQTVMPQGLYNVYYNIFVIKTLFDKAAQKYQSFGQPTFFKDNFVKLIKDNEKCFCTVYLMEFSNDILLGFF